MADEYVSKAVHDLEIGRINDEQARQNKRIDRLESRAEAISELASSVKVLAANMEAMAKEQAKIGDRLDELEAEPGEKWKKAVWVVVVALISAAVGFFLKGVMI